LSPRSLLWFYRRRIRARVVQELFAVVGIAVGVALLFAGQVSSTSLSASIAQLTHGLVGDAQLQLVARDPHGFDARAVDRVKGIPGVEAAAPVLQRQVSVTGPRGGQAVTLLAADERLVDLGGTLLRDWSGGQLAQIRALILPSAVARAIGVRFSRSVTVEVGGRAHRVPVGAVVGPEDVGPLAATPTAVVPLPFGQELTAMPGRVSRVFVQAAPGREAEVEAALHDVAGGQVDVRSAHSEGRLFAEAAMPNDQSTKLFAGISALIGFLFAFNAMLLGSRERRNLIAELRMSGYTFGAVTAVVVFDALVLGVVASAAGLAIGDQLSRHVFHPSPGYLSIAFPVGTARTVEAGTIVLAVGAGTLAAVLATLSPLVGAFRARSMDIVDDGLHDRGAGFRRHVGWLLAGCVVCIAITTVILVAAPERAQVGMATLVLGMLFLVPVALAGVLRLAYRFRRHFTSVEPAVAVGELLSAGNRSVGIAAIAAIAVFGSTAIEGAHRDLQRGLDPNARELNAVAPLWVTPTKVSDTLPTNPFDPRSAIDRLERLPQVDGVDVYRGSFLDIGNRRVWVIAPPRSARDPIPPTQVVDGDLATATARLRQGGWFVTSEAVADALNVEVGESTTLASPQPTSFRLAAVTTNFGWSPGTLVVNADDYRHAWRTSDASALQVHLAAGVPAADGRRLLQQVLGPRSGLTAETAGQREARARATTRDGLARLTQIATLMLLAAALAMAAAMGGMIWQRRARLADLKLAGIGHRQLWRALIVESGLLLAVGCTIGAVFGIYGEQLLGRALNTVTGFPVAESLSATVALFSLLVVSLVAGAIAAIPGWFAAGVPADAAFRE
jgi:putative ABC transport system permease protein